MSKKLEQKQQRREAEERRKQEAKREQTKKNMITLGIAVVVIALVAALVISDRKAAEGPVGVAAEEAGCTDKEEFESLAGQHIDEGAPHEEYNSNPPTSGPHYEIASDVGFFTTPIEPERVVHNLEHGMIVIWYDPEAPQAVKDDIEALVEQEPLATVATPYDGLDRNFYLSAWNHSPADEASEGTSYLLGCDAVAQKVVDDFRRDHQGKGPERIAPPFEG